MTSTIYKLEDASIWAKASIAGVYYGSALDLADGFIHLSAADQVRETASKWFSARSGLVLIGVNEDALGGTLKWEASRGGALFPHIYGPLPMLAVTSVTPLELNDEGLHIFGSEIA
jgi:uncharacterized protein (DUF952 family)